MRVTSSPNYYESEEKGRQFFFKQNYPWELRSSFYISLFTMFSAKQRTTWQYDNIFYVHRQLHKTKIQCSLVLLTTHFQFKVAGSISIITLCGIFTYSVYCNHKIIKIIKEIYVCARTIPRLSANYCFEMFQGKVYKKKTFA